jgi:sugar-specific transcriptional regulator TrmB
MVLDQLEEMGLTHNEALVYTALVEIGETTTGAIVKKTGLHRVLIYDALESLIRKGLASFVIKENRKYFQATDPSRILDFLKEKEEIAKSILPELQLKREQAKTKQQVSIYEGVKGLKSALQNMLKELTPNGIYYAFASGNMADTLGFFYNIYQKEKKKNRIRSFMIYDKEFKKRKDVLKITYGTIKFYPLTYFPTDTFIYNDKVLIVIWNANPPFAVLIINKQAAESYKKMFDVFWKNARV